MRNLPNENSNNQPPSPSDLGIGCEISHWSGSGEVVGAGEIDATDQTETVDGIAIGPSCWKIWVMHVYNTEVPLYRANRQFFYLEEAKGKSVAWPSNCIRLQNN